MKSSAILLALYAIIVLVGGFIGHQMSGSWASLVAGGLFGFLLLISSYFVARHNTLIFNFSIALLVVLFAFFSYRTLLTYKMMPSGMMTILTFLVLSYTGYQRLISKEEVD